MRKQKHDDIKSGADLQAQNGAGSRSRIWRLGGWLGRAVGRGCASGLWTLSPDGKLRCESLRVDSGECD
jgi:hypothetical protein